MEKDDIPVIADIRQHVHYNPIRFLANPVGKTGWHLLPPSTDPCLWIEIFGVVGKHADKKMPRYGIDIDIVVEEDPVHISRRQQNKNRVENNIPIVF